MSGTRPSRVGWTATAFLGLCAIALPWLSRLRPESLRASVPREFVVTSAADDGAGSLREAIVAANQAPHRVRIVLPEHIVRIRTPLPPLVNPAGVVVDGGPGSGLDASSLAEGPALDVIAPASVLRGFEVADAAGQGVLARAPGVHVEEVTFRRCGTGLHVLAGASAVRVERTRFDGNGFGVLLAEGLEDGTIVDNVFNGHRRAAVWAVARDGAGLTTLAVTGNRFDGDAIAIVAMNANARIEDNRVSRFRDTGVFVSGPSNILRRNRIHSGGVYGILALASEATLIEGNETDHNAAAGILLKNTLSTVVRENRVYANAFGIVTVFDDRLRPSRVTENLVWQQSFDGVYVIGGSPVVSQNQVRANGRAGLRIDEFRGRQGPARAANPLLVENVLERNRFDDPQRGLYVE
jgi:hypothetical protein